jgi:hypothetical protein
MNKLKFFTTVFALLMMVSFANAQSNPKSKKDNKMEIKTQYLEVVRFKLKAEVTTEQFLKAENDIRQGKIKTQAGYQGREVYQDADGTWLIIIRWDNKAAAEAWTPIFMTLKEGQAFGGLMDFSSARQEHYTLVKP